MVNVVGAMDKEVRVHYAPFRPESTKVFRMHRGRVKDIGSSYGVPKVFWSVAEDGIVYQFDIRALPTAHGHEQDGADTSGVLIRLGRTEQGRTLTGMGMATHPLDPNLMAIACGDCYTRLYDRRMLRIQPSHHRSGGNLGTSSWATVPAQVFAPPHFHLDDFSDRSVKRRHANAHGTSIQFNSDGSELLTNYHNDHIYLFKVKTHCGNESERVKTYALSALNSSNEGLKHENGDHSGNNESKASMNQTLDEVEHQVGADRLGINTDGNKSNQGLASYQAMPLAWQNGMHMDEQSVPLLISTDELNTLHSKGLVALLDRRFTSALKVFIRACDAHNLPAMTLSFRKDLYHNTAKAYLGRAWNADVYMATIYCKKALEIDPNDREIELLYVKVLHKGKRGAHAACLAEKYRQDYPEYALDVKAYLKEGTSSENTERSRFAQWSDVDEDSSDSDGDPEQQLQNSSTTSDHQDELTPVDDAGFWKSSSLNGVEVNCDPIRRYIGYCNIQTDIKEASFLGSNDAYIVAGSDDGRAFIWEKSTGRLVNAIEADADIVNCVQSHPTDACLATSGIEDVIRLWTPTGNPDSAPTENQLDEMTQQNQSQMGSTFSATLGSTHANIIRLVFQPGEREGVQECATS